MRRVSAVAIALFTIMALGGGVVHADGSTNTNTRSASGVGDVDQSGNININFQGSNDDNVINNTVTTNQAAADASATASATANGGDTSVSVAGDEFAASSAAPVYLTTSNDTCMGSSGVGGQGMSFGFSVGTTWTDSNCIMLKNARELKAQGYAKAAKARLCMDEDNAMAFEISGDPCPRALKTTQGAIAKLRALNADYTASVVPARQLASLTGIGAAPRPSAAMTGDSVFDAPTLVSTVRTESGEREVIHWTTERQGVTKTAPTVSVELAMASVENAVE